MASIACKIIEVCIFKLENDRPWYLLLRRAKNEKLYPGIWQFVSGSIENGEKAVDAALREFQEETGMKLKGFWVVPFVNSFYDPDWDTVNLSPLFAAHVGAGDNPRLSAEHDEFGWIPYEEARRKLVWPGQREGMRIVHEVIVGGEEAARLTKIR